MTHHRAVTGAVLLAAGRGRRLRPYTDTTPKPLLPVAGRPTLDLYSEGLKSAAVSDVVLVAHHLADQIEAYGQQLQSRYDLRCVLVQQPQLDGTASALEAVSSNTAAVAQAVLAAPFLLMATDYLIPSHFIADLLNFHASHNADISISIKRVPSAELAKRSSVRFAHDGCSDHSNSPIVEVVEKPAEGAAPSEFSANLAYVLPPAVLPYLSSVKPSARGEREVQSAINALLAGGGTARGLVQQAPAEWQPESA